ARADDARGCLPCARRARARGRSPPDPRPRRGRRARAPLRHLRLGPALVPRTDDAAGRVPRARDRGRGGRRRRRRDAAEARRPGGARRHRVARRPQQREAALALGADRVVSDADAGGLLGDALGSPIDVVLETVGGDADTLDTAVAAARPGGTICLLGAFTRSPALPALFVLV